MRTRPWLSPLLLSLLALTSCAAAPLSGSPRSPSGLAEAEPPEDPIFAAFREMDAHPPASIALPAPPLPPPPTPHSAPPGPRSAALRNPHFHAPMPGGYLGGWYGDTGLDIAGNRLPVFAIASGILEYSERGHTLWMDPPDTPFSVRIALDEPIAWKGHRVTHVYYTHLSRLSYEQAEASSEKHHVEAGEQIGVSGIGNRVPHLHLGVLLDGKVEQDTWEGILREGDIRALLGGYKNGELLPALPKDRRVAASH